MKKNVESVRTPKSFRLHFCFFADVLKCLLGTLIREWFKWSGTKSAEKKHESFGRPPCNYSVLFSRGSRIIIMEVKSNTRTNIFNSFSFLLCDRVWSYIASDNRRSLFTLAFFFLLYVNSRGSLLTWLVTIYHSDDFFFFRSHMAIRLFFFFFSYTLSGVCWQTN